MKRLPTLALALRMVAPYADVTPKAAPPQTNASAASSRPRHPKSTFWLPTTFRFPTSITRKSEREKAFPTAAIVLDLGGTVRTYAAEFPFSLVVEQGEPVILLGQDDAKLWVSAKFFNQAGELVCEIEKNKLVKNDEDAFRIEANAAQP